MSVLRRGEDQTMYYMDKEQTLWYINIIIFFPSQRSYDCESFLSPQLTVLAQCMVSHLCSTPVKYFQSPVSGASGHLFTEPSLKSHSPKWWVIALPIICLPTIMRWFFTVTKSLQTASGCPAFLHPFCWLPDGKSDPSTTSSNNDFSLVPAQLAASPSGSWISSLESQTSLSQSRWWERHRIREWERKTKIDCI